MIKDISEKQTTGIEIDLTGPEGNAFVLMGYSKRLGKQLGFSKEEIEKILADMKSGDYEHLLEVFDTWFGSIVTMYR